MGWYDAFKGDTARVNLSGMGSNAGTAAKGFGDAFKDIGKSIYNREIDNEKSELLDLQKQNEQNKLDAFTSNQEQKKNSSEYLSTAFDSYSMDDFNQIANSKTKDGKNYLTGTFEDKQEVKKIFNNKKNLAQQEIDKKFDLSVALLDGAENKQLFKDKINRNTKVSPSFIKELNKSIQLDKKAQTDTSTQVRKLDDATLKAKHQSALLKKDEKIIKLTKDKAKEPKPQDPQKRLNYIDKFLVDDEKQDLLDITNLAIKFEKEDGLSPADATQKSINTYRTFLKEKEKLESDEGFFGNNDEKIKAINPFIKKETPPITDKADSTKNSTSEPSWQRLTI